MEREYLLFLPQREEHVMPTQLGNIIRAAELYPFDRYSIDAVVIWPRLHAVLPPEFVQSLIAAKTAMVFMLMMSVLSFAFSVVACVPLTLFTSRVDLFIICALGIPLSWVCYQNALHGATSYGESIKTAFDLHRWKLLEALHLKLPTNDDNENEIWDDVTKLIYRSMPFETASYDRVEPTVAKETTFADLLNRIAAFFEVTPTPDQAATVSAPADGGNTRPRTLQRLTTNEPQPREDDRARRRNERESRTPPKSIFFAFCTVLYLATVGSVTFWINGKPRPQVAVASRDLPAYHVVTDEDVTSSYRETAPPEALTDKKDTLAKYTLEAVTKDSIINKDKIKGLTAPASLSNTSVVAIPATSAMVLGGSLKSGDTVDVIIVPNAASPSPSPSPTPTGSGPAPIKFENVLVLDVRSTTGASQALNDASHPFVLVIAVPSDRREELLQHVGNANIYLTRRP